MSRMCVLAAAALTAVIAGGADTASFENGLVTLGFDSRGRVASIVEKETGRELVSNATAFVTVKADGKWLKLAGFRADGDRLTWDFAPKGSVTLNVKPFRGGWTFTLAGITVKEPQYITLARVNCACSKWRGGIANMVSDEKSAVVLRGYDTDALNMMENIGMNVYTDCKRKYHGLRFGLAAGPRGRIREALKEMTLEAGVPHTDKGGAWSLGAPACRNSYLMAYGFGEKSAPWWVELAERGGFGSVHLDNFQQHLGHYEPITALFPKGYASLSNAVSIIKAAGMTADMHTLTDSIGFGDRWIRPEASEDLIAIYRYTLAEPLGADTNTAKLVVKEQPGPKHDVVLSYIGNGNILQIGTELIQYTGISTNAPWTFTGVKRGALGTKVKAHEPGDEVKYLWQHFITLFAEPESKLGAELYDTLGRVLADCDFDTIYLDGIDGMIWPWRYNLVAREILASCLRHGKQPLYEDSCWQSYTWWFHSRIGAWDYPRWAPKAFTDRHLKDVIRKSRTENMLEPQMGWWKIRGASAKSAIFRLDDHEYFSAKCAANDAATSVMISRADLYPANFAAPGLFPFNDVRVLTMMGWYDRFRMARAFTPDAVAMMGEKGRDVRLRQNTDGDWLLTPVEYDIYRVTSASTADWKVMSGRRREKCPVRFEMLYAVADYADGKGVKVFDPMETEGYEVETSSDAVELVRKARASEDAIRGESMLAFRVTNSGKEQHGAYARIVRRIPHPYLNLLEVPSLGFWVKGDGSGATLCVQASTPREWFVSHSDHYVKLDFTGWRYYAFPLRERNSEKAIGMGWKYSDKIFQLCREDRADHVSSIAVSVIEVPAGGKAEVVISPVRALPLVKPVMERPVISVNGTECEVPFEFGPGQFAELEDGMWTQYDDQGVPIRRAIATAMPVLEKGENRCAFSAKCRDGETVPRAEIIIGKAEASIPALRKVTDAEDAKRMAYEAIMPQLYAPNKGFDSFEPVAVRKGEKADLSFRVFGPIGEFTLAAGEKSRTFPALKKGESARYERAFEGLAGSQKLRISTKSPENADARFEFDKHYVK